MQTHFGRAGRRSLCALTALVGSASLAFAQTAAPPSALVNKDLDAPALSLSAPDARLQAPVPLAPSVTLEARGQGLRWLPLPRLLTPFRHRAEAPSVSLDTPPPSAEELARVQSGQASLVESAAIKIKADEAGAPARRAAIRYLASVRCHYFPEAEAALVAALRADRNETVRVEAAQALAGGCCCTSKTLEALMLAVSGSERDGNPGETSDRVRALASVALQHYSARGFNVPHPDTLPPATKKGGKDLELTSFTSLPEPSRFGNTSITPAELRFVETAGAPSTPAAQPRLLPSALASTAITLPPRRAVSRVPEIHLTPIGVIPPAEKQ